MRKRLQPSLILKGTAAISDLNQGSGEFLLQTLNESGINYFGVSDEIKRKEKFFS
jgi:hypothetical protein